MAFRSDINALILAALEDGPLHGYQIVKRLKETGETGRLSEGQIYPYLHKLEGDDLLSANWETDTGAAPRKVYQLTPKGIAELDRQRLQWQKFVSGVGALLIPAIKKSEKGNV